jgi:DNA-directed RNA polymerase subunit RPC12/RpoP
MKTEQHYCPSCGTGLVSEPIGAPLRCKHCGWRLITLDEWRQMPPFRQGFTLYMQGSWPASELAKEKNPYTDGTPDWTEFCHGERRAMLDAQDGEE